MQEINIEKEWNSAIRRVIAAATHLPNTRIIKQWQAPALSSPEDFACYGIREQTLQGRPYNVQGEFQRNYTLDYMISFYGSCCRNNARNLLEFMAKQEVKDILYPIKMAYSTGFVIGSITEIINARVYNRTDVSLKFSAFVSEKRADYIDKLDISFYKR